MILVALSLVALLVGPALVWGLRARPRAQRWVEGIAVFALVLLLLGRLIPETLQEAGWLAIPVVALGLSIPLLLEKIRRIRHKSSGVKGESLVPIVIAFGVHAFLDGIGLSSAARAVAPWLAVAILVHRIPEGLFVASLFSGPGQRRSLMIALFTMAGATASGSWLLSSWPLAPQTLGLLEALVAGVLLHAVLHHNPWRLHTHT